MCGSRATFVAAVLVTAVVGTATGGPVAPSATDGLAPAEATNGLAEFSLKPGGTVASPGETVRLLVFLRSSPQVASGAYEASFVLGFDTEGLRVTNVTRGRFMSQGEATTVRVNRSVVDNERGYVGYGLVRDPPAGGVTGLARFATVTFEVREDAPAGSYDVVFRRTAVLLTDGGYQQVTSYGSSVTVSPSATEATTETTGPGGPGGDGDGGGWSVTLLALLGTLALVGGVVVLVQRA